MRMQVIRRTTIRGVRVSLTLRAVPDCVADDVLAAILTRNEDGILEYVVTSSTGAVYRFPIGSTEAHRRRALSRAEKRYEQLCDECRNRSMDYDVAYEVEDEDDEYDSYDAHPEAYVPVRKKPKAKEVKRKPKQTTFSGRKIRVRR